MIPVIVFAFLVLLGAVPLGFGLAWLARDELVMGRPWFKALIIIAGVLALVFFIFDWMAEAFTCLFIDVVTSISYYKSFDKKWVKKRI